MVALVYNITEAAFKVMHPMWIAFLLATAAWPALAVREQARVEDIDNEHLSAGDVTLPWAVGQ